MTLVFRALLGLFACFLLAPSAASAAPGRRVPLLVVPGHMGSFPQMAQAKHFPFRRNFSPTTLELASDYGPLLAALEAAGYRRDVDLFAVPWDWRLRLAPEDEKHDGRLSGLDAALTAKDPAFGIGFLGHALARVAAARPDAKAIDVLAHGLGGVLVRAYVQSDAYGTEVAGPSGSEITLPRIRRLVLLSVPNRGEAGVWSAWHGDFANLSPPRRTAASKILPVAFQAARAGGTIPGEDGPIDRKAILRFGEPDPAVFYRLYDAGARALLPTYPFLVRRPGAALATVSKGPASNPLLLDLDATPTGLRPWVEDVEEVIFTHGAGLETTVLMRRKQGPDPAEPEKELLLILPRLNGGKSVAPKPREIWFEPIVEAEGGDGVVPSVSLAPPFVDHPRVRHRVWKRSGSSAADGVASASGVGHFEILANREVLAWIRAQLARRGRAAEGVVPARDAPTSLSRPEG